MKYYNYIVILFIIVSSCSEEPLATPPPLALLGCTDQNAVNYNSGATQDDGSCVLAPQYIPGIQLGDFYQGGTVFYLNGNGGGMVFKDTWQVGCTSGSCAWAHYNNVSLGTSTAFGTGYSNTEKIFNQYPGATNMENFFVDCVGFISSGWHIPSIAELNELYLYGTATYYDSINHPGEIRGWGYGYSITLGNETYTTYGNEYPGNYLNPTIVSSSEASSTTYYSMRFEQNQNGIYNESDKYNIPYLYYRVIGVKSF